MNQHVGGWLEHWPLPQPVHVLWAASWRRSVPFRGALLWTSQCAICLQQPHSNPDVEVPPAVLAPMRRPAHGANPAG